MSNWPKKQEISIHDYQYASRPYSNTSHNSNSIDSIPHIQQKFLHSTAQPPNEDVRRRFLVNKARSEEGNGLHSQAMASTQRQGLGEEDVDLLYETENTNEEESVDVMYCCRKEMPQALATRLKQEAENRPRQGSSHHHRSSKEEELMNDGSGSLGSSQERNSGEENKKYDHRVSPMTDSATPSSTGHGGRPEPHRPPSDAEKPQRQITSSDSSRGSSNRPGAFVLYRVPSPDCVELVDGTPHHTPTLSDADAGDSPEAKQQPSLPSRRSHASNSVVRSTASVSTQPATRSEELAAPKPRRHLPDTDDSDYDQDTGRAGDEPGPRTLDGRLMQGAPSRAARAPTQPRPASSPMRDDPEANRGTSATSSCSASAPVFRNANRRDYKDEDDSLISSEAPLTAADIQKKYFHTIVESDDDNESAARRRILAEDGTSAERKRYRIKSGNSSVHQSSDRNRSTSNEDGRRLSLQYLRKAAAVPQVGSLVKPRRLATPLALRRHRKEVKKSVHAGERSASSESLHYEPPPPTTTGQHPQLHYSFQHQPSFVRTSRPLSPMELPSPPKKRRPSLTTFHEEEELSRPASASKIAGISPSGSRSTSRIKSPQASRSVTPPSQRRSGRRSPPASSLPSSANQKESKIPSSADSKTRKKKKNRVGDVRATERDEGYLPDIDEGQGGVDEEFQRIERQMELRKRELERRKKELQERRQAMEREYPMPSSPNQVLAAARQKRRQADAEAEREAEQLAEKEDPAARRLHLSSLDEDGVDQYYKKNQRRRHDDDDGKPRRKKHAEDDEEVLYATEREEGERRPAPRRHYGRDESPPAVSPNTSSTTSVSLPNAQLRGKPSRESSSPTGSRKSNIVWSEERSSGSSGAIPPIRKESSSNSSDAPQTRIETARGGAVQRLPQATRGGARKPQRPLHGEEEVEPMEYSATGSSLTGSSSSDRFQHEIKGKSTPYYYNKYHQNRPPFSTASATSGSRSVNYRPKNRSKESTQSFIPSRAKADHVVQYTKLNNLVAYEPPHPFGMPPKEGYLSREEELAMTSSRPNSRPTSRPTSHQRNHSHSPGSSGSARAGRAGPAPSSKAPLGRVDVNTNSPEASSSRRKKKRSSSSSSSSSSEKGGNAGANSSSKKSSGQRKPGVPRPSPPKKQLISPTKQSAAAAGVAGHPSRRWVKGDPHAGMFFKMPQQARLEYSPYLEPYFPPQSKKSKEKDPVELAKERESNFNLSLDTSTEVRKYHRSHDDSSLSDSCANVLQRHGFWGESSSNASRVQAPAAQGHGSSSNQNNATKPPRAVKAHA